MSASPHNVGSAALTEAQLARRWADEIATAAGSVWLVQVNLQPPYGWRPINPAGTIACGGSLNWIEQWVKRTTGSGHDI